MKMALGHNIRVRGGNALHGEVQVGGSKNLGLPALAAALLTDEPCTFVNVPAIDDVRSMLGLIKGLGAQVDPDPDSPTFFYDMSASRQVTIRAEKIEAEGLQGELAGQLRASVVLIGPLLARLGKVVIRRPGGDPIGARPLDVTFRGLRSLGAEISPVTDNEFQIQTKGLIGGKSLYLDYPTHTGTENLLMAAVLATGTTTIVNACCEPEIVAFGEMLQTMGADISGLGTPYITIRGGQRLRGVRWHIKNDRLVAGTYAVAAVITRGSIVIRGVSRADMLPLAHKLREAGATVAVDDDDGGIMTVDGSSVGLHHRPLRPIEIQALHFPGFPTDQQAIIAVLMTQCQGESRLRDRVFENRLRYLDELRSMGADAIEETAEDDPSAKTGWVRFNGPTKLNGKRVNAYDIRAGAAMVLAGLAADGETTVIDEERHLSRGYESLVDTLRALGGDIEHVAT